jgi:hypothetical protein
MWWCFFDGKSTEASKVRMHHSIHMSQPWILLLLGGSGISMNRNRPIVPPTALVFSRSCNGWGRHCVLMERSRGRGRWRFGALVHRRPLLEPDSRRIESHMLSLGLNSLVCFGGPATRAIARRRTVVDVKAVEASLKARIVQVQVSSLVLHRSFGEVGLIRGSNPRLLVDHHGRRLSPWWGGRRERVERLDAGQAEGRLRSGRVRDRRWWVRTDR